jgi:uncharacterized protein YegL
VLQWFDGEIMNPTEISRANPTALVFLIDQSGSMKDPIGSTGASKAAYVADVVNRTITQLITRNQKRTMIHDRVEVSLVTYQGSHAAVDPRLHGNRGKFLKLSELHPVARVEERKKLVQSASGEFTEQLKRTPIWFDPVADGDTPMVRALNYTADLLEDWCSFHRNAYPPTIIHVTDGDSKDGDPQPAAERIKSIRTNEAPCILMNMHVNTHDYDAILFPNSDRGLDNYGQALFRMSSRFTPWLVTVAERSGHKVDPQSRLFAYKAGSADVVNFFELGSTHE